MRPAHLLVTLVVVVASCGNEDPIPERDLAFKIVTDADQVGLGEPFAITVERVWSKRLVPEPWDDTALAPLVLRPRETQIRENDTHVQETLRFDGFAFDLGRVEVTAPTFTARPVGDGPDVSVRGDRITLRVTAALDPAAPGSPELPGDLLAEPVPWLPWSGAALAALGVLALRLRGGRKRTTNVGASPQPPREDPVERALRRLEELDADGARSHLDVLAFHVEIAHALREYVSAHTAVGTEQMSTEEFVSAPRTHPPLADDSRRLLATALTGCDRVKFGRDHPDAGARRTLLGNAVRLVRESGR